MVNGSGRSSSTIAIPTVAVFLMLFTPALASAATRYVDDAGADVGVDCTQAAPCATLAYAIGNSLPGEPIHVDNGTYLGAVTLNDGRSLVYEDFVPGDGAAPPLVDGGATTGITVSGTGGGLIAGVRIHGDVSGITLNAPTVVDEVISDEPSSNNAVGVQINAAGGGSEISDSQFSDPAPSTTRARIGVAANGAASIHDNTLSGFNAAIFVNPPSGGDTIVERNQITGTHNSPFQGRSITIGANPGPDEAIARENEISAASGSNVIGIYPYAAAQLVRNEVSGHRDAVFIQSDETNVTITGDRYWGNEQSGVWLFDTGSAPPQTSAVLTNVTSVDSGADVRLDNAHLTLNSSILEIIAPGAGSSCSVTHSIGPPNPGGDTSGCFDFVSNADPGLADPATGDLHLTAGSPAIDNGDPADPGAGAVDFDGDPRAVDGADACPAVARRDIGADEFVPAAPIDCTPPQTSITSGTANGGATNDPTQTFGFASSEGGSTFECAVDSGGFGPCSAAATHTLDLSSAPDGQHTVAVRATDSSGNTDPTPAERTFTLDRVAPPTGITSGLPDGASTNDPTQAFGISSSDATATLRCKVDEGAFGPCTGPSQHALNLTSAPDGEHTFAVRATDPAGNVDLTPATRTFRLDRGAPETTLTKRPPKKLKKKKAVFAFSADEASEFTCRLDDKPEFGCAGDVRLRVKPGRHTFSVFGTDAAGNADASPASYKFKRVKKRRHRH